jgi:hypothetical protein
MAWYLWKSVTIGEVRAMAIGDVRLPSMLWLVLGIVGVSDYGDLYYCIVLSILFPLRTNFAYESLSLIEVCVAMLSGE